MLKLFSVLSAAVISVLTSPVSAQSWDSDYHITSYLWFPDTKSRVNTDAGRVTGELSVSDALKNLDFGVMLRGETRKGAWALVGDLVYLNVGASNPTPFETLYSSMEASTKLTLVSAYGLYRVEDTGDQKFDLGAGLRAGKSEVSVALLAGSNPTLASRAKDDWIDPVIAARYTAEFQNNWTSAISADYGGWGIGSSSEETWQILATASYAVNENWTISGGFRHLRLDQKADGHPYRIELSGPILGTSFNF